MISESLLVLTEAGFNIWLGVWRPDEGMLLQGLLAWYGMTILKAGFDFMAR